jgi:chorismate mutase/prephenate dehydratase
MVAAIERWRDEIDAIDAELLSLLNRRVLLAREVGRRKRGAGLPLRDARRERRILARARERNRGPLGGAAVERLFRAILAESRRATRHTLARKPAAGAERSRACA